MVKTVLTYGTYDLFHIGHVLLLQRARSLGDRLVVGISSDEFNAIKGKKSVFPYEHRAAILASLRCVDEVFPEQTWEQKPDDIRRFGASVFVMGHDWEGQFDWLNEYCEVMYLPRTNGISTTDIKALLRVPPPDPATTHGGGPHAAHDLQARDRIHVSSDADHTPSQEQLVELASRVFPGYGAFGPDAMTALSIPVGATVDQALISLDVPRKGMLNIHPPEFHDETGGRIPSEEILASVTLSSLPDATDQEQLLSQAIGGAVLRTRREAAPAITVTLTRPTFVSRVVIPNVRGMKHRRSRGLAVQFFRDGVESMSYHTADPARMADDVLALVQKLGIELPADEEFDVERVAGTVRDRIQAAAESGTLSMPLQKMVMLLPMFEDEHDPDEYERTICAGFIVEYLGDRNSCGTRQLRVLGQFLHSATVLEDVRNRADRIAKKKFAHERELTLSKHHIHYARLVERRDEHLDGLDRLFAVFDELSIPLVLSYGTLLGAVREGSFLKHDDDVDLLYFDGSRSSEEMKSKQRILADQLAGAGFRVDDVLKGRNFHVYTNGVSLDLFPSWIEGDRLHLLMEQMRFRDVPASILFPESSASIHGRSYPAPANPEAFLAERYGKNWRIPDPYYGWPWKVNAFT